MKVKNTRQQRQALINQFGPENFENYYDYFFYLHLNDEVKKLHLIGMLSGLFLFPFALYFLSWKLFLLYLMLFYGLGFISHWLCDGQLSRTAKEAPWYSFAYATKINWLYLTGQTHRAEEEFLIKYPFARTAYEAGE